MHSNNGKLFIFYGEPSDEIFRWLSSITEKTFTFFDTEIYVCLKKVV